MPLGLYQNDTVHAGIISRNTCTLVVIAFALFTTIVLYHLVITILNSRMGRILTEPLRKLIYKHKDDQVGQELTQPDPVTPAVTQSEVVLGDLSEQEEIKEPLLKY